MEQLASHISRIQTKLQELLKKYAVLQKEHAQQQDVIKELQKEVTANKSKVRQLEEQQLILKSAAGKMNEEDKKVFEKTIGSYIKEIDKCIAMLSE